MTRPDPHASYREHVSTEAEAVEETPVLTGVREALTERILQSWRIRFPNNAYAWPARPHEFASAAAKVCMAVFTDASETESLRGQLATARKALEQHFALMRADRENGNDLLWTDAHEDLYHATEAALNSGEQK